MQWGFEERFIYEFVKAHYGNGIERNLEYYFRRCDQPGLTERILQHDAIPFFYNAVVQKTVCLKIPQRLLHEWKVLAGRAALQNALYEEAGAQIISEIQELGIRCILLKGFTNMDRLYGDRMRRPVGDLDILIGAADYPRVKAHLLARGFRQCLDKEVGSDQEAILFDLWETMLQEMHFAKSLGVCELNVDVHWGFSSLWMFPVRELYSLATYPWFEYTERMTLNEKAIECLRPELHFLHCVYHFALNNRYTGLKWFIDLCQYIVKFGHLLDWNFINGLISSPDSRKILLVALNLVAEVTGNDCSPSILRKLMRSDCKLPDWEYRFYKKRLFAGSAVWQKYLCSALLPCKQVDRMKVIKFMLFHRAPLLMWQPDGAKLPRFLYPIYIFMKEFGNRREEF